MFKHAVVCLVSM